MSDLDFDVSPIGPGKRSPRLPQGRTRRRITGLLATLAVLLAVGALILPAIPNLPSRAGELLNGTPTPTATLAPRANLIYLEHWVPWGRLTIDGAIIPNESLDVGRLLARGVHALGY